MITAEKVRIICGRCQIIIPVTWGCRFPSMLQRVRSNSTARFWKPNVPRELQESAFFEMMDKSLHVKLVIVTLIEHNSNQQISLFNLRCFNSTRKFNVDESFVSSTFKPDTALAEVSMDRTRFGYPEWYLRFFGSGLDLDIHFWKKLDQDRIRIFTILVWFLLRNFSWEWFKMSQMMVAVFSSLWILYC